MIAKLDSTDLPSGGLTGTQATAQHAAGDGTGVRNRNWQWPHPCNGRSPAGGWIA